MVKYFTEIEISFHKNPEDCWVSIFDNVYDISELIKEHRGILATPLINAAGTSISHWFNEKNGDLKTFIDPEKNIEMPYTPYGRFIHVPPTDPTDKIEAVSFPWWKDRRYIIGKVSSSILYVPYFLNIFLVIICFVQLTKKTLKVRITNMLTRKETIIQICQEETISEIKNRYMEYNLNSNSYTWKALIKGEFVTLQLTQTLEENGINDETEHFVDLGMDEDFNIPNIYIYYNDDLNYA